MVAASPLHLATAADLARLPPDARAEIIGGAVIEKASPSGEHAYAQGVIMGELHGPFNRRPDGQRPGGWWILPEVEVELAPHEVYRPDIAGWRRDRVPSRPTGRPVLIRPDWVCEILSPSNASNDLVKKFRVYHHSQVPHYWIVDPDRETLAVYRWTPDGYLAVLAAARGERVRAEPFDAIELQVSTLFGDEDG